MKTSFNKNNMVTAYEAEDFTAVVIGTDEGLITGISRVKEGDRKSRFHGGTIAELKANRSYAIRKLRTTKKLLKEIERIEKIYEIIPPVYNKKPKRMVDNRKKQLTHTIEECEKFIQAITEAIQKNNEAFDDISARIEKRNKIGD